VRFVIPLLSARGIREVREASRARAPDSPVPGEHMDVRTARLTEKAQN
jgi:hypothetical protein